MKIIEKQFEGEWKGVYEYKLSERFNKLNLPEVEFDIKIEKFENDKFIGTVEDNLKNGGTPGIGKIEGRLMKNKVKFVKKMPIHTTFDESGNHEINSSRKHPLLIYRGDINDEKMIIEGKWEFKKRILWWKGIIPFLYKGGEGTFKMWKKN